MKKIYSLIFSLATLIVAADQWTKNIALEALQTQGRSIPWIKGFNFTLVYNYGAAFGMLNNLGESIRGIFFLTLPVVVLGILWWTYIRNFKPQERLGPIAMGLVIGGALGNFIDRVRFGYVVDFVDWFYTTDGNSCIPLFFFVSPNTCHWPVFNIADSAICVAMVLLIGHAFLFQKNEKN